MVNKTKRFSRLASRFREIRAVVNNPRAKKFAALVPNEFHAISLASNFHELARFSMEVQHNKSPMDWVLEIEKMAAKKKMSHEEIQRLAAPAILALGKAEYNTKRILESRLVGLIERINAHKVVFKKSVGRLNQEVVHNAFNPWYFQNLKPNATIANIQRNFPVGELTQKTFEKRFVQLVQTDSVFRKTIEGEKTMVNKKWVKEFDELTAIATALKAISGAREKLIVLAQQR